MTIPDETLSHKTRANHFKRIAVGGHLWLQEGPQPALVFRAHGFFQRRYELRLSLVDMESVAGWTITMRDGTTERFVVGSGTGLESALLSARTHLRPERPDIAPTPAGGSIRATSDTIRTTASSARGSNGDTDDESGTTATPPQEQHDSSRTTAITTTPSLPGFKHLEVLGFSTALTIFAQAVPRSEWGYALNLDGEVIAWEARTGLVSNSQNNVYESVRLPARRLPITNRVVQISGSQDNMLALDESGDVWAWGEDYFEEIGQETRDEDSPLKISTLSEIVHLASTGSTHFAIRRNGDVWSWGSHYRGLLGDGSEASRSEPNQVPLLTDISEVRFSARKDRAVALSKHGAVWTWGYGYSFDGDKDARSVPTQLTDLPSVQALGDGETAIGVDGRVWQWSEDFRPTVVPELTRIVEVVHAENSLGWESTYHALDGDGHVYGWGYNNMGQIGDGTTVDRQSPVPVAGLAGVSSLVNTGWTVYALTTEGVVYGWGGFANERVPDVEGEYGPSPQRLSLPLFTESRMQRWATLDLVSLGTGDLRQTFFDFREGRTPLMQCAASGFDDEVAVMLSQSGDLDAVDADGDSALFYAASKGQTRIVELLLQAGADPNIHRRTGGNSALAQSAVMSLSFNGAPHPRGKGPQDFWDTTLRLLRGGADPSDMYSRHIAPARHTDGGIQVIRPEHLQSYVWNDDLFPIQANLHRGLI